MRLVSLNLWGGKIFEPLVEFLKEHANGTDVFCFQEMLNGSREMPRSPGKNVPDLFQRCGEIFSDFEGFFDSVEENWIEDMKSPWGLATFMRRNISLSERGDFFVFRERNTMERKNPSTIPRLVQFFKFIHNQKQFTLCNFHGLYKEGSKKLDNPDRFVQSRRIKEFLDQQSGAKILCGDFNLAPETESMHILENGMRNLINEYGITSTRSPVHYHNYATGVHFADYILVSPAVAVHNFQVPSVHVSDHLPMILEFD